MIVMMCYVAALLEFKVARKPLPFRSNLAGNEDWGPGSGKNVNLQMLHPFLTNGY